MRKYYILTGVIDSKPIKTKKKFNTRDKAINYVFDKLNSCASLQEEIVHQKHVIEYKFNETTRFIVSRQFA